MVLVAAVATLVTLSLAPAPALADHAVSFQLIWIRCQDQNESFSDEPYVKVNGETVKHSPTSMRRTPTTSGPGPHEMYFFSSQGEYILGYFVQY